MNLQKHTEHEFELLKQQTQTKDEKPVILQFEKPIKKIVKIFSKQGHSGMSANVYSSIVSESIKKILKFETLSPLTGEENEWNICDDNIIFQNKRNSAVFKQDNIVNYIDGIIWQNIDEKYDSFTGTVENISSNIKGLSFPLTPKTFRIDVKKVPGICPISGNYHEEKSPEGKTVWHYEIVDKDDLKEVEKYYGIYLGEPEGDALRLNDFDPLIQKYIKEMRKSLPDYETFSSFVDDVRIISKQIKNLGGRLRSRQVLAILALPYLKYDN